MEAFYSGKLGMKALGRSKDGISLHAGGTVIEFVKSKRQGDGPLHHFAFNIPQNKIRAALDWARKRFELIPAWGALADPSYPKEVIYFRHWNAHSIFFWDPAFNLVEFIARHDLSNDSKGGFSSSEILCASEIGLPTTDPVKLAKLLNKELPLPAYPSGTSPQFAMGDQNGLLLCLLKDQTWPNSPKKSIKWGVNRTEIELAGTEDKTIQVPGYPFTIRVIK